MSRILDRTTEQKEQECLPGIHVYYGRGSKVQWNLVNTNTVKAKYLLNMNPGDYNTNENIY